MGTIDLSIDKPVVGTGSDANLFRNAFDTVQNAINGNLDANNLKDPGTGKVYGSNGAGGCAAVLPPGYEFTYDEFTSNVTVTATSEATANTVVTAAAVTFDGTTSIWVELGCVWLKRGTTMLELWLYQDGSSIGRLAHLEPGNGYVAGPLRRRLTPPAGSHTYSIRASVDGGSGQVGGGAGSGAGVDVPGFILITKA